MKLKLAGKLNAVDASRASDLWRTKQKLLQSEQLKLTRLPFYSPPRGQINIPIPNSKIIRIASVQRTHIENLVKNSLAKKATIATLSISIMVLANSSRLLSVNVIASILTGLSLARLLNIVKY